MKVVRWTSMKQVTADGLKESLGGFGGWFTGGKKDECWGAYLERLPPESRPYAEALRAEVVRLIVRHGGFWHQYDPAGTPVFEDGTCAAFSMRAWGDFLAAVWSDHGDESYSYCDFAWHGPEDWPSA